MVAVAAIVAGVAGYAITFLVGVDATTSAECDGVCFDKVDEVGLAAIVVGLICAVAAGIASRHALRRRLAKRKAKLS